MISDELKDYLKYNKTGLLEFMVFNYPNVLQTFFERYEECLRGN